MSRLRCLLLSTVAACAPLIAGASPAERLLMTRNDDAQLAASTPEFDYCLKDRTTGSVFRFNSSTGKYVVCGNDGTFEQGFGTITQVGSVITLSHTLFERAFSDFETVHATVDTATAQGQAQVRASNENQSAFTRINIDDPNLNDGDDCSACGSESAANEGVVNFLQTATVGLTFLESLNQATLVQKYSFNSDFNGNLTRFSAGISNEGSAGLSFQFAIMSDNNGRPGDVLYLGPVLQYPTFPAFPTIGIVQQDVNFSPAPVFWAGIRWNPSTDPLVVPLDTTPTSPKTDVFECGSNGSCDALSKNASFAQVRNFFLSVDYKYPTLVRSKGMVRFDGIDSSDIISSKSSCSYSRIDLKPSGLSHLYAENPAAGLSQPDYSHAFARITPLSLVPGTGLDGIAETYYGDMKFAALSYIANNILNFCTRPEDATDFVCHPLAGYVTGTCGYTRIVGRKNGFEVSCANAPADRLDRWFLQYQAGQGWNSQALNPVQATPSIGSPEFGFPWFKASGFKLGVAYEYKTTAGAIQAQLLDGNTIVGTYAIDTDDPPAGFNPSLATRMGGDCTRSGLCLFGRYDSHTATNVVDLIDFRESPPNINSWTLGSSPQGFGFGRDVSIDGRDGSALYSSYTTSPIANQYKLQLDYLTLTPYKKYTLSFDYGAGGTKYPLSLSHADGDFGLGHARGVDAFYSLTAGCRPADVRGHSPGHDSGGSQGGSVPCENIPLIIHRF